MEEPIVIITTAGSEEQAHAIADTLINENLAACVNLVRRIRSIYRWKGEIFDDEECLLIIKTRRSLFEEVRKAIKSHHTYELPEVIALQVSEWDRGVGDWILSSTKKKD